MKNKKLAFCLKSFLISTIAICAGFIAYNNTIKDATGTDAEKNLGPMRALYHAGKSLQDFQDSLKNIDGVKRVLENIQSSKEMPEGAVRIENVGDDTIYLITVPIEGGKFVMFAVSLNDQSEEVKAVFHVDEELSKQFNMFVGIPEQAITEASIIAEEEQQAKGKGQTPTKSSSAGIVEQANEIRGNILAVDQNLFNKLSTNANIMTADTLKEYMKDIGALQKLLEDTAAKSPEAMAELHKDIEKLDVSLETMNRIYETSLRAQETGIRDTKGTIVINENEIPENQRAILTAMLDKASPYLQALESKLGCVIRLLSQYSPQTDRNADMIAISSQPIEGITKNIDIQSVASDGYMPLEQIIILAKGLLAYNPETAVSLSSVIGQMYNYITKSTLPQSVLDVFLQTSRFVLDLPALVAIDPSYYEHLHKQALSALISA
ncbi:MAG: hypothetical protein PHV77_03910 [Candidatus Omnitrophica bacterium]|nr:hypothetical protein [Candidatus Omnitrophota bacterium]